MVDLSLRGRRHKHYVVASYDYCADVACVLGV